MGKKGIFFNLKLSSLGEPVHTVPRLNPGSCSLTGTQCGLQLLYSICIDVQRVVCSDATCKAKLQLVIPHFKTKKGPSI